MATTPRRGRPATGADSGGAPRSLSATTVAQFVRLESCERYLWHRLHNAETRELFRQHRLTEQPLTPLLTKKGAVHEEAVGAETGATAEGIQPAGRAAKEN